MRTRSIYLTAVAALCALAVAPGTARADVCVAVDEAHDTFSAPDRAAALLLLEKQWELAGEQVVPAPCADQYVVSHIQLGPTIAVTLSGPQGRREATASGLEDIPAVYNQMVRSLLTGRPMSLGGVVDRTNVSSSQAARIRVDSDNVFYVRLGYGTFFNDRAYGAPSVGLIGYRHELDSFAIDVSFLNFQVGSSGFYGTGSGVASGQYLKLEGLYFKDPHANQSLYFGGGLSWTMTTLTPERAVAYNSASYSPGFQGNGLQGEVTAGYELARASTIRLFVQADAGLPFYTLTSTSWSLGAVQGVTDHRYAPSLTVSVGLGWQKGAHKHR